MGLTWEGPRNHVWDGPRPPRGRGNIWECLPIEKHWEPLLRCIYVKRLNRSSCELCRWVIAVMEKVAQRPAFILYFNPYRLAVLCCFDNDRCWNDATRGSALASRMLTDSVTDRADMTKTLPGNCIDHHFSKYFVNLKVDSALLPAVDGKIIINLPGE